MKDFPGKRSFEILQTVITLIIFDVLGVVIIKVMDSYLMLNLIKMVLLICNIFFLYYIGVWSTVKYTILEDGILISALWGLKKVKLALEDIESYTVEKGKIKGIGLSGISSNRFAIGRIVVKMLGTTRMFVTSNEEVIYINSKDINYGISPVKYEAFEEALSNIGIERKSWTKNYNKVHKLYKEKQFIIPMGITSVIILMMTFMPLTLYVFNKLPNVMPLVIGATGKVIKVGTDKQFAFAQMLYGILNMAILFCMYYAAYFCAKYDKKTSYKYIHVALLVSAIFFYLQIKLISINI